MEKNEIIRTILNHYYDNVAEFQYYRNTIDYNDEDMYNILNDAENACLRLENLLVALRISFTGIYGDTHHFNEED